MTVELSTWSDAKAKVRKTTRNAIWEKIKIRNYAAKRKEAELETNIAKSTRIRERTQKLLDGGQIIDVDAAQEQIDALSVQLESLEEAYLEALEEQDAQTEVQLRCDNFIGLFQKSHREAIQKFQEENLWSLSFKN